MKEATQCLFKNVSLFFKRWESERKQRHEHVAMSLKAIKQNDAKLFRKENEKNDQCFSSMVGDYLVKELN